jgi:predicted Zn-dependent protease
MDSATTLGLLALGVFVVVGLAGITAILSAPIPPPAGRAAFVPNHPSGPHVYLAPIGTFRTADLDVLVAFYAVRYDLEVKVLAPAPTIPPTPQRNQIDADALGSLLQTTYREAADPSNVIIGVLSEDIYQPLRPDFHWVYGAIGDRVSVISTYRMRTGIGPFGDPRQQTRLRKMVTRYIGFSYFGLARSADPQSVLYDNLLGPMDLELMGEDF